MSYSGNKFGSTKIRGNRFDNLSISWDYDDNPLDKSQRIVVFLHTPDIDDKSCGGVGPEHSHIELSQYQAKVLRNWLINFFKDIESD